MDFAWLWLKCLWWLIPAGIANTVPVLVKNRFKILAKPVDFNSKFFGKPILGSHKTWRGLIMGTIAGSLIFLLQQWLYQFPAVEKISLIDYSGISFLYGFLLAFGGLFGDLAKSFLKRRFGIHPGRKWFPFDQVDWVVGSLALSNLLVTLPWYVWLVVISLGAGLHFLGDITGISPKMKNHSMP